MDTNQAERAIGGRIAELLPTASVTFAPLPVADFQIRSNGQTILIERKTFADFCSSTTSGRLAEQAQRMLEVDCIAIVLIGGVPPRHTDAIGKFHASAAYGMMNRLELAQGIHVMWCNNETESFAQRISQLAKKLQETGFSPPAAVESTSSSTGRKRGRSADRDHLHATRIAVLQSVPGVSQSIAEAVLSRYSSIAAIAASVDLADLPVGSKRLGGAVASRISAALA